MMSNICVHELVHEFSIKRFIFDLMCCLLQVLLLLLLSLFYQELPMQLNFILHQLHNLLNRYNRLQRSCSYCRLIPGVLEHSLFTLFLLSVIQPHLQQSGDNLYYTLTPRDIINNLLIHWWYKLISSEIVSDNVVQSFLQEQVLETVEIVHFVNGW